MLHYQKKVQSDKYSWKGLFFYCTLPSISLWKFYDKLIYSNDFTLYKTVIDENFINLIISFFVSLLVMWFAMDFNSPPLLPFSDISNDEYEYKKVKKNYFFNGEKNIKNYKINALMAFWNI